MDGDPTNLSTGEIIRHLRERRGMSRAVLAGLVGYSTDWLKRIERGERGVSLPALLRIARVLRVDDLSVLVDGDRPMPISAWEGSSHPAAVTVREIVGDMSFSPSTRTGTSPDITDLARSISTLWTVWHTVPDNRSTVADRLPALIAELERATIVLDGTQARRAQAALASAYSLAQHLAVDITEPEVGRVLVDRAARAARAADDPVSLAFGAWSYGHVLRALDPDNALRTVAGAAAELEQHLDGTTDSAALLGSLKLHCAVSAAHQGQDGVAWRFWDAAENIGRTVDVHYSHPQTAFGRGNVALHGVSIAALLRRHGEAVQRAEDIDAEQVPSRERRGRLYGEIAAGHLQRREFEDALRLLEQSFVTAPETTPFSPLTRGAAVELARSARGATKSTAVELAERMGILPSA
ncbi:MAG TPA: helix-turn-helix transcriptional regulator [Pseudonocardiaceae bacterium]|nr:helix-turn-helix transcriptional regulator [Pseudonocardiaceae bacterium]